MRGRLLWLPVMWMQVFLERLLHLHLPSLLKSLFLPLFSGYPELRRLIFLLSSFIGLLLLQFLLLLVLLLL